MACNCCCTRTLRLCSQNVCSDATIDFGITAQVDGVHILRLDFLSIEIFIEATLAFGDRIVFPIGSLNENFEYRGRIYDPNEEQILISKDGVIYDCIAFQTVLMYAVA